MTARLEPPHLLKHVHLGKEGQSSSDRCCLQDLEGCLLSAFTHPSLHTRPKREDDPGSKFSWGKATQFFCTMETLPTYPMMLIKEPREEHAIPFPSKLCIRPRTAIDVTEVTLIIIPCILQTMQTSSNDMSDLLDEGEGYVCMSVCVWGVAVLLFSQVSPVEC